MPDTQVGRPVIAFTETDYYGPSFAEEYLPRLAQRARVCMTDANTEADLIAALSRVDVAVIQRAGQTRTAFAACSRLLAVIKWGAGVLRLIWR